ncbi:respiratory nitrate reductase subunit gamma [Formicincola oecophyllae]|uniref:nitrate reductase (quinone) n=1 Tax=Formicincola oecophyllae TaxID=2558361 RepID=A0A4Y6U909_9PROT|nr:respiratory nitrate reductase subunit gamma [Formicincola oecophyllae]QDH13048.1 respiratory nitrate reductase subunit gamma [Formicincola oecophyllae]
MLNWICFGVYPYVALTVFLLGSFLRHHHAPYSWKADSSQLLRPRSLRLGSNLFHVGVLGLFAGHGVGLLTPHWLYQSLGLSAHCKQLLAMGLGGVMGTMALVGLALLIHRRLMDPRIRCTSRWMDFIILGWLFMTLCLGLTTIPFSWHHADGHLMMQLADWAQAIVTLHPAAGFMVGVPLIYRLHMMCGMTLFVLFPFSRLVHVWSGFASVAYLARPPQITRSWPRTKQ